VILKIITSFHFNDPGKESNGKLVRWLNYDEHLWWRGGITPPFSMEKSGELHAPTALYLLPSL
jgi:hypothetical protein